MTMIQNATKLKQKIHFYLILIINRLLVCNSNILFKLLNILIPSWIELNSDIKF